MKSSCIEHLTKLSSTQVILIIGKCVKFSFCYLLLLEVIQLFIDLEFWVIRNCVLFFLVLSTAPDTKPGERMLNISFLFEIFIFPFSFQTQYVRIIFCEISSLFYTHLKPIIKTSMLYVSKMYSIVIHQPTLLLALALSGFFPFFFLTKC